MASIGSGWKTTEFQRTVIGLASVRKFLRFTKRMHKIRQTCRIQMRGVVGKQRSHKLAKAQIKE
jgi:hypothetical protein